MSSPTCLHFLHLVTFTGVAALRGRRHLSGPVNQLVVKTQTLRPLAHWHVTVTFTGALIAEDVVSAHAVALGVKLYCRLTAKRGEGGCEG